MTEGDIVRAGILHCEGAPDTAALISDDTAMGSNYVVWDGGGAWAVVADSAQERALSFWVEPVEPTPDHEALAERFGVEL